MSIMLNIYNEILIMLKYSTLTKIILVIMLVPGCAMLSVGIWLLATQNDQIALSIFIVGLICLTIHIIILSALLIFRIFAIIEYFIFWDSKPTVKVPGAVADGMKDPQHRNSPLSVLHAV